MGPRICDKNSQKQCWSAYKMPSLKILGLPPFLSFFTFKAITLNNLWASLIAQLVKNQPAMQETLVLFLGWKDLLEKGQATHSSILGLPWWLNW